MPDTPAQPAAAPKELGKPTALDRQIGVLRFSLCGRLLAAGDYLGKVQLWDATKDELSPLPQLDGHHGWVDALAFGGDALFTADTWGRLSCWRFANASEPGGPPPRIAPQPAWSLEQAHDGWLRQLALSPDGKQLATCGRDTMVRVFNTADGKLQHEFKDHGEDVYSVAFHPTQPMLVSGDLKGIIREWHLATGKPSRKFDAGVLYKYDRIQDVGGVRVLRFSADGLSLFAAGATPKGGGFVECSPRILRFDFKSGKQDWDATLGEPKDGYIHDACVLADGTIAAVTSGQPGNGKLLLLKPGENQPLFATTKMANCHSIALHPGGKRIAVTATNTGSNGNGRQLKDGKYLGNTSPIFQWTL